MSDDLVNQITLNFLISKQQLQKLNKKIKQKEEDKMKTDMEIYKEQFVELFNKMLNDNFPDDLLEDVKHSYTYFVEKSIYYLKMKSETNKEQDQEQEEEEEDQEKSESIDCEDDSELSNAEKQEELSEDEDEDEEEDEDEDEELSNTIEEDVKHIPSQSNPKVNTFTQSSPIFPKVYKKINKSTKSKGVDDIQHLPLDWFNKVKQTNKHNQIIPRSNKK